MDPQASQERHLGEGEQERFFGLMFNRADELKYRIGEIHQRLFKELVSLPSTASLRVGRLSCLLMSYKDEEGNMVASVQYLKYRRPNKPRDSFGARVFVHHALTMVLSPDGILHGQEHDYVDVERPYPSVVDERVERAETVHPLSIEGIYLLTLFAATGQEQLRNSPE